MRACVFLRSVSPLCTCTKPDSHIYTYYVCVYNAPYGGARILIIIINVRHVFKVRKKKGKNTRIENYVTAVVWRSDKKKQVCRGGARRVVGCDARAARKGVCVGF